MADSMLEPLRGQQGLRSADRQISSEQLKTLTTLQLPEPRASRQGLVVDPMENLPLGSLRILRTLGSAIQLESSASGLAHLAMPARLADACREEGHCLQYVPPGAQEIEMGATPGILMSVDPEALLQIALSMAGAGITANHVHAALASPRTIPADCEPNLQLANILYSAYQNRDPLVSAGDNCLRHSRIDDLILRLWVLLLIPELRLSRADQSLSSLPDETLAWVNELADWVAAHADRPLTLSDLERQSGYSRRSLQVAFRTVLGCTPMQWVKRCRLQNVRERLEHPLNGDSVGSVAKAAGFNNSAFTRDFVRHFGVTPSAVLRQARRNSVAAP
jgi:AraC-like DNA-binding protein